MACVTGMAWWWLPGLVLMRTLRLHLEVAHAGSHDRLMAHKLSSLMGRDRILHSSITYAALIGVKGSEFKQSAYCLEKPMCFGV